jgi:hypothetical protein
MTYREMLAPPDQQISLTDPDSRSMATSGRGSGVVGYNVQIAVDTQHHLIVTHEVTNTGSDRSQLAKMASQAKVLEAEHLNAVADRGYFNSHEQGYAASARSSLNVQGNLNGALSDGSTSMCSKPCNSASMPILMQCASVARQSNIRSRP